MAFYWRANDGPLMTVLGTYKLDLSDKTFLVRAYQLINVEKFVIMCFRYFLGPLINQCDCLPGFYGPHCEIDSSAEGELDEGNFIGITNRYFR